MRFFTRPKFGAVSRFFAQLPGFSRPDKHSLYFLNAAQFGGVLNDNIFKLVIAFLLIDIQGKQHASSILSTAGAIFVIPFLLFSSAAGVIADRFSKQRLLVGMKIAEMMIMVLAIFAFGFKSSWGSYCLLFLLSTHSAMFGPSKYAIISELVPSDRISRANGLVTSFTYLGVIVGTFLASFLTEMTDRNFVLVAGFCFLIAAAGFISTFGIKYTPPQGSQQKINPLFIREIYHTLVFCKSRKHLLIAITGSAFFLFIGAFTQLNIIPMAIESLHLNEIYGGYLFLSTALGISLGSYIAGKASKQRIELGLPCLSGIIISMLLFLLSVFSNHLFIVIFLLVLLGIFGGMFIVPFDSFVQIFSPSEKRGQIIAASAFLSFFGVLVASISLYFFSQVLDLSSASGFALIGVVTLWYTLLINFRLSDLALPYMSKKLLKPFMGVRTSNLELLEVNQNAILVLKKATWMKMMLLLSVAPKAHLLLPEIGKRRFPWFNWMFYSVHLIPTDASYKTVVDTAKDLSSDSVTPCIAIDSDVIPEILQPTSPIVSFFKLTPTQILYVDVDRSGPGTLIKFSKK
jgi:acyl-[acyl-carrier-protein]-phospholipid O-acyltransferase/long-chain-fatty-acid--[acyl-carrier-protein] ligase